MNKIKALFCRHKTLLLYALFGCSTTVVSFVCFKLCNVLLGNDRYLISNVIAWLASVVFAYLVNKQWVFASRSWKPAIVLREIGSFFSARLLSLGIEQLGLYLLVDVVGWQNKLFALPGFSLSGPMVAKVLLSVIVVMLNYFFSKLVIFKTKS